MFLVDLILLYVTSVMFTVSRWVIYFWVLYKYSLSEKECEGHGTSFEPATSGGLASDLKYLR